MTTCLHRRQARPDETGFSLVELMITTLLISTVFAIAIPAGKAATARPPSMTDRSAISGPISIP
ncbi:MAG: prepilin-type N-terminal cleavage/methylation domain-containing protein [Acidobacteria bacterium]|nr:prepilin-type N-terminal cleavage/methylation domain-containing protein [Acidobacteriota bacterium]